MQLSKEDEKMCWGLAIIAVVGVIIVGIFQALVRSGL